MKFSMFSHSLRKKSLWVFATLFSALVAGCADDETPFVQPDLPEGGYITLSLNCVEGTRAEGDYTEPGNTGLHENLISTVTICLWAKGGDKPDDTATPDYVQTFENVGKESSATLRIPLTIALRNKLFETSGAECHAFAAVNVGVPEGNFTIEEYRKMAIESDFAIHRVQTNFAMDGDAVVSYDVNTNAATGWINLQRSASKISLALDVDPIVDQAVVIDGNVVESKWQPNTAAMRVYLKGGLAESTLDPDLKATPSAAYFFDTAADKKYLFDNNNKDNGNNPGDKTYPFIQHYPFYTYPHSWSAEPGDYAATYMTLVIPWRQVKNVETDPDKPANYEPVEGTSWRTCYYQVPVIAADSDPLQLVRNIAYHVYLHVGLLGSFIPDEPLELEDELEYSAAEWGTVNMDVNIPDVRYLVVDQNDYTVNNETSINIPFYTSHETIVTDATMTFYRYNYDDVGRELPVVVTMAKNEESAKANRAGAPVFTAYFNNDTKELEVTHDLVMYQGINSANAVVSFTQNDSPSTGKRNPRTDAQWNALMGTISYFKKVEPTATMADVAEYSRIEFKITVQHKDMSGSTNFQEVINITQYPGIYIETTSNYCQPNATTFTYTGAQGSTYINTFDINRGGTDNLPSKNLPLGWTVSIGLSTSFYNFNPNMYLVTVTTLPEGTKYKIGDPRSNVINNNLRSSNHDYNPRTLLRPQSGSGGITGVLLNYNSVLQYMKALITNGVNSPLPENEDRNVWAGTTYNYDYWMLNLKWSDLPFDERIRYYYISNSNSGSIAVEGFKAANSIYPNNNKRDLSYYYPTREDAEHKYMIAPKFRICSSYAGTTWILNRELARRRAASYQELGYAAGRWRLPTFGEVEYIMELAAQYKIPRLFGTFDYTWWYWCANGLVCVPSKSSGKPGVTLPDDSGYELPMGYTSRAGDFIDAARDCHRARFVYDEWYWGKADLPLSGTEGSSTSAYTFTWGDKPMTTTN